MITLVHETIYVADKEFFGTITSERYPGKVRKIRLLTPGPQYIPAIKEVCKSRGFTISISEER